MSKGIRDYLFKPFLVSTLFLSLLFPVKSRGDEKINLENIFKRVAIEMKANPLRFDMPRTNFVSKPELEKKFAESSKKSYKKWKEEYGEEKANEFMNIYSERVGALYNGEAIYVNKELSYCERLSKTGHELKHFFQEKLGGKLNSGNDPFNYRKIAREIDAYKLEKILYDECILKNSSNLQLTNQPVN